MPANVRELHCEHVSASEAGDYFQVLFARTAKSDEGYLLVQRQFEMRDEGECYVETDDLDFGGHFRVRNAHLARSQFRFEFSKGPARAITVFFKVTDSAYAEARRILQIMIPELELG